MGGVVCSLPRHPNLIKTMAIIQDDDQAEKAGMEETALLPKSLLMGKTVEPGDRVVLKIVRLYEDEVEVEYSESEETETKGMTADQEIDSIAAMPQMMNY